MTALTAISYTQSFLNEKKISVTALLYTVHINELFQVHLDLQKYEKRKFNVDFKWKIYVNMLYFLSVSLIIK